MNGTKDDLNKRSVELVVAFVELVGARERRERVKESEAREKLARLGASVRFGKPSNGRGAR